MIGYFKSKGGKAMRRISSLFVLASTVLVGLCVVSGLAHGQNPAPWTPTIPQGDITIDHAWDGLKLQIILPNRKCTDSFKISTVRTFGYGRNTFKACMLNKYGKGKAIFLNFPLEGYNQSRYEGAQSNWVTMMRRLLGWCGIPPRIKRATCFLY